MLQLPQHFAIQIARAAKHDVQFKIGLFMTHGTLSYSFEIGGNRCGQMDVHRSNGYLRTVTEFETPETGHVLADFEVWFDGLKVIKARKKPLEWVAFAGLPNDAFPDCAYPLLIQKSQDSNFDYWCVDLEQHREPVLHKVSRTDDLIVETRGKQVLRRFSMDDGIPAWIDWGGASSSLL